MRIFRMSGGRAARVALAAALVLAWSGAVPCVANRALAQPAAPSDNPLADPATLVALLKRLAAAAEQELRKPGADPSDVRAKAAELGHDPARVWAFVLDEVAYEPYRGVLRGARGALAARAGNALDKSLLLKEMLEAGGHEARLVRGRLRPDAARARVDRFLKHAPARPAGAEGAAAAVPASLAEQTGVPLADLQAVVTEQLRAAESLLASTTSAADVEAEFLRRQLDAAGLKLGRTHEQWVAELTERAADHAWVERVGPDGTVAALDPTLAAGHTGATPAPAPAPPPPPAEGAAPTDLDAQRHRVRFQLVYVVNKDGKPDEDVLIDVPLYADQALYDPPVFTIEPADPLPPPSKLLDMERDAFIKLMTGFKNYQAVLHAGGVRTGSQAFDLKGNVTEITADGRVKGAQQIGAATGGLFGGGALGGGDDKAADANNFLELAVVLTFESPGAAPASQRRVLLTQAQTTGDEFLSPILEWKILLQPQPLSAALAGFQALDGTTEVLRSVLPTLDPGAAGPAILDRVARAKSSAYPGLLMNLSGLRESATAAALRANVSLTALWDRPQMSIAEQRYCANRKEGRTCGHAAIDIVDNAVSFVPRSPDAAEAAARASLRQGVFDTVAEAAILMQQAGGAAGGTAGGIAGGAIDALRAARQANGRLAVLAPPEASASAGASLSPEDRKWVAAFEAPTSRVAVVVGAPQGAPSAWWSIDPQTGRVLGRRDGGRGSAMTEDIIVQLAASLPCLIGNAWNTHWDMKKTPRMKLGASYYLGQLGCLLGAGFGVGGVIVKGSANTLTLINAFLGMALSMGGGELGRNM